MTDRELLEQAAKAAGIEWVSTGDGFADGYWKFSDGKTKAWWNPLTDDGDALRLAVKLGMGFEYHLENDLIEIWFQPVFWTSNSVYELTNNEDLYAATRRAIVRAAAKIGKG